MTPTPEVLGLHPTAHPLPLVRQVGFPLDHAYIEQCWAPVIGPSSASFLRHCVWHWDEGATPARIATSDLAAELGLGRGTGHNSPLWSTIKRLEYFRFARLRGSGAELDVFTRVPPVEAHRLDRLPGWVRGRHDVLLGEHLDAISRQAEEGPPINLRMATRLDRMSHNPPTHHPSLGR